MGKETLKGIYTKILTLPDKLTNLQFMDNYFDIVTMWHVFEHIYDPNSELQEIKRILKDDGLFVIAIPNIDSLGFKFGKDNWFHLDAPRHLYYYDNLTINKILKKNGFEVIKINYPFAEFPLDLYHTLMNSFMKNRFIYKIPLAMPILITSLLLKPVFSLCKASETMMVVCRKRA